MPGFHCTKVYSPQGLTPHQPFPEADLGDGETYSISLMTTLSKSTDLPFVIHMVTGTNDQYDFLGVIADFIEAGYLVGMNSLFCSANLFRWRLFDNGQLCHPWS
jgi:hypothetical protein